LRSREGLQPLQSNLVDNMSQVPRRRWKAVDIEVIRYLIEVDGDRTEARCGKRHHRYGSGASHFLGFFGEVFLGAGQSLTQLETNESE